MKNNQNIIPSEGEIFWADPIGASPELQKKYIGITYDEYTEPVSPEIGDYDSTKYRLATIQYKNPFTGNIKDIQMLEEIPVIVEDPDVKFARIYKKLLAVENLNGESDKTLLEGVAFSKKQIGDFIVDYVFEGNPHEQTSIFAKILEGNKQPEFLAWVAQKTQKTNDVLAFFNMAGL